MQYAVIKTGGKQYIVSPNDTLLTDRLSGNPGDKISFDEVLLYVNGESTKIGTPFINGVQVEGKIIGQELGEKIRVGKYKSKSRYRRVMGFRSRLTKVMIEDIKGSKKEKGDK